MSLRWLHELLRPCALGHSVSTLAPKALRSLTVDSWFAVGSGCAAHPRTQLQPTEQHSKHAASASQVHALSCGGSSAVNTLLNMRVWLVACSRHATGDAPAQLCDFGSLTLSLLMPLSRVYESERLVAEQSFMESSPSARTTEEG
eukprot:2197793-Amphidinium_carterae.2